MRIPLFRIAHVGIDILLCLTVFICSYLIRFEGHIPEIEMRAFWFVLPLLPLLRLTANALLGLYSHLWKYVGVRELFSIFQAVLLGSFFFILAVFLGDFRDFPRSIFILEAAFYFLAVGGARFSRRYSSEVGGIFRKTSARRTLIIGAGDAGAMVCAEMLRHPEKGFFPIGFLDDNPKKWRARLHGLKIFGGLDLLEQIVEMREVETVLIAMPSVSRTRIRKIVERLQPLGIAMQIVPATHQILSGEVQIEQLRPIEIEDLLGRDPVNIDDVPLKAFLEGKRVVVSGAGGSIGSELCHQILGYNPEVVLVLGHGENSIYQLLRKEGGDTRLVPVVADIRDEARLKYWFDTFKPQVVFHAAAHKHVPLMESNLVEALSNNVLGSYRLLQRAAESGVEKCILISTDKAAEPSSLMGLSKYLAELTLQRLSEQYPQTTFNAVRFGNVMGSRGSVIPLFQKQIEAGGPITITDFEMTRYFMTIPEAVQLVLQASILGEEAETFVLDMGEPVKIMDLALNMIRLSGLKPDDIPIKEVGMRPGEKLHETLVWSDEPLLATTCPQIRASKIPKQRKANHLALLDALLQHLETDADQEVRAFFNREILPVFEAVEGSRI